MVLLEFYLTHKGIVMSQSWTLENSRMPEEQDQSRKYTKILNKKTRFFRKRKKYTVFVLILTQY